MADFLKVLDHDALVEISADFDYIKVIEEKGFVGLKLMPMVKTDNLKVAIYNMTKGASIPVIALVHALDAEARIGDRPNIEEFKASLFLIKEKINQGEELRKRVKELGMSGDDYSLIKAIYDDIALEISKVLTGFERRACEALCKAKLTINENGANYEINYNLADANKVNFSGWNDPTHDILGDLVALQNAAGNKIVRQIISKKVLGYILNNNKLNTLAANDVNQGFLTQAYAFGKIFALTGIQMIVDDRKYKKSYADSTEYYFFDQDVVVSLTTDGEVGKTLMTSTPTEDADMTDSKYGFVAVHQWKENDPYTSWTKAEGIGLPVFNDINNTLYLSTITAL